MTSTLTALVAAEHTADLRRAQREAGRGIRAFDDAFDDATSSAARIRAQDTIALRLATADDTQAVRRLAELDEEPELTGEVLLAVVAGEAVAALSLEDGRVVSNPFVATSDAITLLQVRMRHLTGTARRRHRLRLRPRFA